MNFIKIIIKWLDKINSRWILVMLLLNNCYCSSALAELQKAGLWNDLTLVGYFPEDNKFEYLLNGQLRWLNQQHYFQTGIFQTGLGYKVLPKLSLWGGYQWESGNQIRNTAAVNRLWQQTSWNIISNDNFIFDNRNRLEERESVDQSQLSYRLRERFTLLFPKKLYGNYTPLMADELFFNLNKPVWVSNRTFEQNRFFVGIDIPVRKDFFEIGYLNRYIFRTINNEMDHILYLSYNFRT